MRREVTEDAYNGVDTDLYIEETSGMPKILGYLPLSIQMIFSDYSNEIWYSSPVFQVYKRLCIYYPAAQIKDEIVKQDLQMFQDLYAAMAGTFGDQTSNSSFSAGKVNKAGEYEDEEFALPSKKGLLDVKTLLTMFPRDSDKSFLLYPDFGSCYLRFRLSSADDDQRTLSLYLSFAPMPTPA